jgi:di/tricarboxylate transporter
VIANTPLVAGLAPVVRTWADRAGVPASRLLMPLSFAAIIGGVATTIGTSTTLVASGVVAEHTGTPFGFLEVTPLGVPFAIVGVLALVLLAPSLLPERAGAVLRPGDNRYSFRMVVEPDGPLDGRALEDAGLRNLPDLFIAAIVQGDAAAVPARPDARLGGGDELVVVGDVRYVRELPVEGLRHADERHVAELEAPATGLHEVVLGPHSPLLGRTLKGLSFRGRFDAAVLAINRGDQRLEGKLGQVPLQAGDALLLQAGPGFTDRWRDSGEFALVASLEDHDGGASSRRWFVAAVTLAMVAAAGVGVVSLLQAVLWACAALVVTRTLSIRQALEALDLDVLLIIAAAIGLGGVVESSGLAAATAGWISDLAANSGPLVALVALLVGTTILTEVVTNVASAALMVPIALSTATALGEDPRGWAIAVALTASTSLLTPIGYQTNTIVYGLGGYRFGDYWRLGLPLVVLWVAIAAVLVPIIW